MVRLLAVAAGIVVLAGCGSSDDGPKRTDFAARADAECARLARDTRALAERTFEGAGAVTADAEGRRRFNRAVGELQRATLERLRTLTPPPGEEGRVREMLAAFADASRDPSAPEPLARFRRAAAALGARGCARAADD